MLLLRKLVEYTFLCPLFFLVFPFHCIVQLNTLLIQSRWELWHIVKKPTSISFCNHKKHLLYFEKKTHKKAAETWHLEKNKRRNVYFLIVLVMLFTGHSYLSEKELQESEHISSSFLLFQRQNRKCPIFGVIE